MIDHLMREIMGDLVNEVRGHYEVFFQQILYVLSKYRQLVRHLRHGKRDQPRPRLPQTFSHVNNWPAESFFFIIIFTRNLVFYFFGRRT